MQVDGVEEELPDELENACSDDGKMLKYIQSYIVHTEYFIILHKAVFSEQWQEIVNELSANCCLSAKITITFFFFHGN